MGLFKMRSNRILYASLLPPVSFFYFMFRPYDNLMINYAVLLGKVTI